LQAGKSGDAGLMLIASRRLVDQYLVDHRAPLAIKRRSVAALVSG
jgi:hypothetical protein